MALQNQQEKKLVIEIKHPEEELREIYEAIEALSNSGLPREEIFRQRRRIKEAQATQPIIRAYTHYLKSRLVSLEKQLAKTEGVRK